MAVDSRCIRMHWRSAFVEFQNENLATSIIPIFDAMELLGTNLAVPQQSCTFCCILSFLETHMCRPSCTADSSLMWVMHYGLGPSKFESAWNALCVLHFVITPSVINHQSSVSDAISHQPSAISRSRKSEAHVIPHKRIRLQIDPIVIQFLTPCVNNPKYWPVTKYVSRKKSKNLATRKNYKKRKK